MIRNYLKIAVRNLLKHKVFSIVNVLGLSLGIAACLTIFNYLHFERSYDTFHNKAERIYRVPMEITEKGGAVQTFAFTYPPVAPAMKQDFPEVEEAVRWRRQGGVIRAGDNIFSESGQIYFVDKEVLKLFDFPFVKGDPNTALHELNDVVITEEVAKKYFGNADPIGQSLRYRDEDFVVKAILKDIPENSHINFGFLFSFDKYIQSVEAGGGQIRDNWRWSDFYTYVLLKPGADPKALEAKLPAFAERHISEEERAVGYETQFKLQPLLDIHLKSKYDYEFPGNGNFKYLNFLAIAGLLILIIAWVNYINLSTARALERSKEVGIRKVVGAFRHQLMRQFLTESMLINLIAIVIGALIFHFSLPAFRELVGKEVPGFADTGFTFWLVLAGLFLIGALLAGFYPAFIMSGFKPIQTLKGHSVFEPGKGGSAMLRKVLVVGQFAAAIILIAGVIGLYQQMNFMRERDLGINIDQTLVVQETMPRDSAELLKVESFLTELERHPDIITTSASTDVPGKEIGGSTSFRRKNTENEKRARVFGLDTKFIPNYDLKLAAGRNFSESFGSEEENVILNEAAVRVLGFESNEAAIGQLITYDGGDLTVVGVLQDYHQESMRYDFDPTVFYYNTGQWRYYSLKVNTSDMPGLLAMVEQKWKDFFPGSPYQTFFLDEFYDAQFKAEQQFSAILWTFTFLAIIVACLGLLGLSSFTLAKKSKEISIRKVLGASVAQIVSLVTKEYVRLILISAVIAIPLAYIMIQRWLESYTFRVEIGWWFFVIPVMAIILIAFAAIGWQSVRAARANPAERLKME